MTKLKKIKAWAVWDEKGDEPWGVPFITHNSEKILSYGLFETKQEAEFYRHIAFEKRNLPKQKIIQVLITPTFRAK